MAFWGGEARVWPVLFFVPILTKTCFSSQEAWEEFAPGNERSSSWKRAQTGLEAEQKGQAFIHMQWHFLVWSIKSNFAMEGFWNVYDKNVTEVHCLLWRYPQYFIKLYLCISGNISGHQYHTVASLADTKTTEVSAWSTVHRQSPRVKLKTFTLPVWTSLILMSSKKSPLPPLRKFRFMKHLYSYSTPSVLSSS